MKLRKYTWYIPWSFVTCSYLHACSSLLIGLTFMSHFDDRSPRRLTHFSWQVPLKPGKSYEMQSIHLLHGVLSCRKQDMCAAVWSFVLWLVGALSGRLLISVPFDPGHFHQIKQLLDRIWAADSWLVCWTCWKVQWTRARAVTGHKVFPRCVLSYVQRITATFSLSSWHT